MTRRTAPRPVADIARLELLDAARARAAATGTDLATAADEVIVEAAHYLWEAARS